MLTVALAAGCERESKGPRVYNHPPATVGPPADLSQFDAPAPPAPGKAPSVPVAQVAAPAPSPSSRLAGVAPGGGRRGGHGQARSRRRGAVGLRRAKPSHPPHRAGDDNFPQRLGRPGKRGGADDSTGRRRGGRAGWSADGAGPGDGTTVASTPPPAPLPPANDPPVVNNHYYGALDPYGDWFYDGSHGWVWRPTVAVVDVGWRPYSQGGRWIYSDVGWYWNSYYSWGWAPFHYGRWHRSISSRLVLGARLHVEPGMGHVALQRPLRRLGAAAAGLPLRARRSGTLGAARMSGSASGLGLAMAGSPTATMRICATAGCTTTGWRTTGWRSFTTRRRS